ncbi:MAG: tetratricopeptide repeat protein [Saccharospirillum sp.]
MTFIRHPRQPLLATVLLSISLVGCTATPARDSAQTNDATPAASPSTDTGIVEPGYAPLSGQTFYQLLLAEIATNRRDYATAAELYSRLDRMTEDADIAQRATALNQAVGQYPRMQEHAEHWTELDPANPASWQGLTVATLANRDFNRAEPALRRWLALDENAEVENAFIGTEGYSDADWAILLTLLESVAADFPNVSALPYARGQILAEQGNWTAALVTIRQARAVDDRPERGLLEYRILVQQGELDEARSTIETLAERFPDNAQVATAYASFAYADEAQDRTEILANLFNRFPNEPLIVRTFARESFDNEDYDTAEALFTRLQETEYADEAYYFLGRINRLNARDAMAADYLLQVERPPFLISALAELSELWRDERLGQLQTLLNQARGDFPNNGPVLWRIEADALRQTGQGEQAFQALQQGLASYPNEESLLYDQALLAAQLERYEVLEANLTTILENDPDNAMALNALGYTWADLNKNLEQAVDYIDRALAIRPDDPAFMDSKGWVEYRLGNLETAERWLRRAALAYDNDEVAAHLAEVLWMLERRDEARQWLREALELNPDSPTAADVIERLEVDL